MSNLFKNFLAPIVLSAPLNSYDPTPDKTRIDVSVQQDKILSELMEDQPQEVIDKIKSGWETIDNKRAVEAQSSIDSIAYRQLFDGTELANDSNVVKEFNQIAQNSRPERRWGFPTYRRKMDEILKNHGISQQEIYRYESENQAGRERFASGDLRYTERDNRVALAKHQFKVDSVAYQRFFEKHKLLNSENKKVIKFISQYVKPKM